jgi:hypothetical protein
MAHGTQLRPPATSAGFRLLRPAIGMDSEGALDIAPLVPLILLNPANSASSRWPSPVPTRFSLRVVRSV